MKGLRVPAMAVGQFRQAMLEAIRRLPIRKLFGQARKDLGFLLRSSLQQFAREQKLPIEVLEQAGLVKNGAPWRYELMKAYGILMRPHRLDANAARTAMECAMPMRNGPMRVWEEKKLHN